MQDLKRQFSVKSVTALRAFGGLVLVSASAGCVGAAPENPSAKEEGTVIHVDVSKDRHPISPLIYGVNFAKPDQLKELNSPINRSGGNSTTRYNWKLNATSSGNDWFFLSHAEEGTEPGQLVETWIKGNKSVGAASIVSIPIIGWVAKINPDRTPLGSFSIAKYGAQQRSEPFHADIGNGTSVNGKEIVGNDPKDANIPVDISYQKPWIEQLTAHFGTTAKGGVACYLLDNEPGIWQSTHRDVFPTGVKMEELFAKELGAAKVIKSVDPSALVGGPEEWGWTNYQFSGYDSQYAGKHGWDKPKPDRAAHGDVDIMPWLLKQFAKAEKANGKRMLDIFTLHFYPQAAGVGGDDVSYEVKLRRNRSTRALWDPNYKDESWIGTEVKLIPRMKQWVAENYPGTKIGLTEYNWGAEKNMSGAVAQADVLGIFGREGLDLATRWVCPATGSQVFHAIQMYRNYDGKGGAFGDTSVRCTGGNPDELAVYASTESRGTTLRVMIINKKVSGNAPITVKLDQAIPKGEAQVYQLTGSNKIEHLPDVSISGSKAALSVPAESITLLVIPTAGK